MYDEERAKLEGRLAAIRSIVDGAPLGTAHLETQLKRAEYDLKNTADELAATKAKLERTERDLTLSMGHLQAVAHFVDDVELILSTPRRSLKQIRGALRDFLGFDL